MKSRTPLPHSLTRLALGSLLLAIDEINSRLPAWDQENPVETLSEYRDNTQIPASHAHETEESTNRKV
jgi:hypothetical protein